MPRNCDELCQPAIAAVGLDWMTPNKSQCLVVTAEVYGPA